MNIMRKLLSQGSNASPSSPTGDGPPNTADSPGLSMAAATQDPDHETNSSQAELLGLTHLKKLFSDYKNPPHPLSESEKESKLYMILPLFCKTFASCSSGTVKEKLKEATLLTKTASRLLVTEVRRRASNQSTEEAAEAIVSFLEVNAKSKESSNGWMLLSALNILVSEGDEFCEIMTNCAVPSTLVKCLYLFFDLRAIDEQEQTTDAEFTRKERRILLQKMFIQLLLRLCIYVPAVEELARKDDLTLLFSAVTSSCPSWNVMWRKTASDILLTISKNSLSQPVVSYLHNKGCIAICVENMQKNKDNLRFELVEMFVSVFCFLKDSSEDSPTLMEDFRTCQGYIFLTEFLLKLEKCQDEDPETEKATRNLVLLIASLSFCGHSELSMPKASSSSTLHQQAEFKLPTPENKGSTVRNLQAVRVLQAAFLKSQSEQLSSSVLDAFLTVYSADAANYFLLENEHTLSQFAEKIALKPFKTQEKFFQLVEFLVQQLKYVPCKELISISLLLKSHQNPDCCIMAIHSLINIAQFDKVFKDVFREVGMIEVLVTLLQAFSDSSSKSPQLTFMNESGRPDQVDPFRLIRLGEVTLQGLAEFVASCNANAIVFRQSGGIKTLLKLIKVNKSRREALKLMQSLILSGGNDDDMNSLLELLHTLPQTAIDSKSDVIKTLIACLRESHRSRATFRRVGGFVYLISVLVSLESSLSNSPKEQWEIMSVKDILLLLKSVFCCLSVAMRFEPANARYFQVELNSGESLVETVKLLGCFSKETQLKELVKKPNESHLDLLQKIFNDENIDFEEYKLSFSKEIFSSIVVLRLLHDMAIDSFVTRSPGRSLVTSSTGSSKEKSSEQDENNVSKGQRSLPTLNLTPVSPDPVIVHPSVVTTMIKLLPSLYYAYCPDTAIALQIFTVEVIRGLLRTEKNQQIMCDVSFVTQILKMGKSVLENEAHVLHAGFQAILERLAAQKLDPLDLRTFLRLGYPLACLNDEERNRIYSEKPENQKPGSFIPLTRIKTLVSMTTPRDLNVQHNSIILPPFIEMDMSQEGFGCIFLPSIAPFNANPSSVVGVSALASQEGNVIGGIGQGDRSFPPQPGLTFSTWICIDKFSDPRSDPHPVRLLTICRQVKGSQEEQQLYCCLCVCLSARDKAIIISTQETPFSKPNDWQPEFSGEYGVRIWFPDLVKEGEWHHLVFVLNRQVLKNASVSVFVNGQHISTQRMQYINPIPGGVVTSSVQLASTVHAFIGTAPQWRRQSRLCWKQGPCMIFEDIASPQLASLLHKLGPHYLGSLQAPQVANTGEVMCSQINEEKILFGLNAVAVSEMTLSKIRKVYSRFDNKAIARQLFLSTTENATPIKIIHNSAAHLLGPSRSLGGVIIGYLGSRIFTPQPVSKVIETVGGCDVLLGIIAMARDMDSLYAGVKALVCVLKSNPFARGEMEGNKGYLSLALLLRKKVAFLNSHVLYLMFTLAGTIDPGKDVVGIPNLSAFRDVLCDLELWHNATGNLEKSLFEHFHELLFDTNTQRNGFRIRSLRDFNLVDKLLSILRRSESSDDTTLTLLNVVHALLCTNPRVTDVLCFALFTAATLNPSTDDEKKFKLNQDGTDFDSKEKDKTPEETAKTVMLRNRCLKLFFLLLYNGRHIHTKYCEDVVQLVGFDWVLLFFQGHLHPTTVLWGLRILMTLVSIPNLMDKFKSGSSNGHWLLKSDIVLQDKMVQALGQRSCSASTRRDIRQDIFSVPGFQQLNWLMPHHIKIPEAYFLLIAMVLGQPVKELPNDKTLDLDAVWNYLFGVSTSDSSYSDISGKIHLNGDAIITLLTMIRTMLNCESSDPESLPDWLKEYPVTLTHIICYLYHNVIDFIPIFMTEDITTAFVGTLFPYKDSSTENDEDAPLTNHPSKRNILQFMRVMVVDSLSLPATPKQPPVIDLLLDAKPEMSSRAQQRRFQTELLSIVMDHLLAADALISDQAAIPITHGGSQNNIAPNVFYLASRMVDKLWQGIFKKDPDEVFQFILKLIIQAKRKSGSFSVEGIFKCLNRTILYLLSKPHPDVVSKVSLLEVLQKITTNRSIIFGAGNHELEFFACITFCLLQITEGLDIPTDGKTKSKWHVRKPTAEEDIDSESQALLSKAATKVWEELYVNKRPALEEALKASFGTQNATPKLSSIRDSIYDHALKVWLNYVDLEKRAVYSKTPAWEYHNQLESRIQMKLSGVLQRLTSVTGGGSGTSSSGSSSGKSKKEESSTKVVKSSLPRSIVEQATLNHIAIVKDVVDQHYRKLFETDEHMFKFIEEEWLRTEARLTQERGIWGPMKESPLTKWMLDLTEGPSRRRQRLVRNDLFYLQYPYREDKEAEEKPLKYKRPSSMDSKLWYEQHESLSMFEREEQKIVEELEYDDCDITVQDKALTIDEQMHKIGFQELKKAIGQAAAGAKAAAAAATSSSTSSIEQEEESAINDDSPSSIGPESDIAPQASAGSESTTSLPTEPTSPTHVPEQDSSDYQAVMRLLEDGEKITHMYRCARIQGLDTAEGLMLFGREHFYILDGFTLVNGKEVHDIDLIPDNRYIPIIPVVPGQVSKIKSKREVNKFLYDNIKEVHKRRYLLQPIAVEIFSTDGQNQLLAFNKNVRPKVYQRLLTLAPSISDCAQQSVAGQKRSANVEQGPGLLSSLMGETSVTQRWVRGEISNFSYLMALNTLAGRSYNDLMQYPVFPWVLADYRSEELDLNDPDIFRDFSKPMGAQTEQRLEQFKRRFEDWDDPHNETPPYHYGTHYSSAMIVSSYLVRLEPFTQHFLHLQGGHFDLADRMFHSVQDAWESASKNNMADLRELIPEFFYLPDFLENNNNFDLGMKQNGERLHDVRLPPWAKDSAREFIRVHREALESDYVSAHLHEWIDLIFGYKQQGPAAVEATNVFHHLFYEGNVDIFSIDDPLQRNATIGFINNFGQIPKQLFKKPHPCKRGQKPPTGTGLESAGVHWNSKVFFHHLTNLRPTMAPIKELKGPVGQIQSVDRVVYAVEQNKVLVPGNANRYLAWGFADQSFRLCNYDSEKAVFICEPNYLIGEVLTCVCPNAKVVLTAGTSTVVAVYEYHKKLKQLLIKKLLYGHTEPVTCLAASPGWNIAVSGSRDRTAIIWDLSRYCYVKHLSNHVGPVASVTINELTGDIVTCAGSWFYLWDINGRLQASVDTAAVSPAPNNIKQQVLSVCCSEFNEWDRENVIMTGSSDGVVRMWSLDYVEVPEDYRSKDQEEPPEVVIDEVPSDGADGVAGSLAQFAKKMSMSMSADCLNSLKDVIAQTNKSDEDENDDDEVDSSGSETEGEENNDVNEDKLEHQDESSGSQTDKSEKGSDMSQRNIDELLQNESPNEDFVVVSKEELRRPSHDSSAHKTDGYTWAKRLVFRAKLTMHTAFEREDNIDPAAVTALAVSKDHRTIFVGDEKGRVFSWSVSSKPGKGMVDHWCRDEGSEECLGCGVRFTIYERRHHCRACGKLFCSSCSQYQSEIPKMKILQKVRVCKTCFDLLNDEQKGVKEESKTEE